MNKLMVLVAAGLCTATLGASGCNRVLPSMEPYDEYKARLQNPQDLDQQALPVLKTKDSAQPVPPAKGTEDKK